MPHLSQIDWKLYIITLVVIILSITLHEFGHAFSADYLGDPGPRRDSRVNLWPDKHFDPLGFIMILWTSLGGLGLGWGKPVMVDSRFFRHPRRDMMIVTACGPLMNLILAIVFGLAIRVLVAMNHGDAEWLNTTTSGEFLQLFVSINLNLMFFNLIPIHPLDGGKLLSGLLPVHQAIRYDRFFGQWGPLILLFVIFSGPGFFRQVLGPPVTSGLRLLTGLDWG